MNALSSAALMGLVRAQERIEARAAREIERDELRQMAQWAMKILANPPDEELKASAHEAMRLVSESACRDLERRLTALNRRARMLGQEPISRALLRRVASSTPTCLYCLEPLVEVHLDHFLPLVLGGAHAQGNLVPCCPGCNLSKGAKHPTQWLSRLPKKVTPRVLQFLADQKRIEES